MSSKVLSYISPEEYLRLERQAEYKSEYLNGEIFAMTGASRKHNLISINLSSSLSQQLKGKSCEVYGSDMRVKVTTNGLYTYPDVVGACGKPDFEDDEIDTLLNPTVLIEILSTSTERYDRIAKTSYYRTLDSLAEHLLVAQHEYRIEQYVRGEDQRWSLFDYRSLDDIAQLQSIGCSLALRDVYDRIEIDPDYRPKSR
jgi:Uma2 family endonuclease